MRKGLLVLFFLFIGGSIHAQNTLPPSEPDTDTFLATHFHLQDQYTQVLCVAQDGSCPSEITTTVPCLTNACTHQPAAYPIGQTFDTIQAASDAASAGTLIIIMPGRYAGVQVEERGGDNGAYIHFLGWGDPGSIVIDRSADPTKSFLRHHFYFIAAHHYLIQNLAFEAASDGAGIFFSGYFAGTGRFGHHLIVMEVYSHDNGVWGLHTTSASYILIQDSVFTNSGEEHGAYLSGSGDHMVIRRNVFQGNPSSGLQVNADPQTATSEIYYWLETATGDTCGWSEAEAAQWEDMKACYDSQGLPDLGEFIEDGISEDLIIEQNVMTANGENGAAGINLASVRNTIVRNNLIYGNFAAGITCWDNAYAEEKSLSSSQYGCQNVRVINNTMVDEAGNRGALIFVNDARDMQAYNNIIVRDRFDAYEVAFNSGTGMQGGNNYYFAQNIEESPGYNGDTNSITGFSVQEALTQFVNPNYERWVLEDGAWPMLNPNRPDYHLRPDSLLARAGNPAFAPTLDAFGAARTGTEIGALTVGDGAPVTTSSPPVAFSGTITYGLNGQVYLLQIGGETINITAALDTLLGAGMDYWLNISPDGQWLVLDSERLDPECIGWPCLIIMDRNLTTPQVVRAAGTLVHPEAFSAVASGGNLIVYPTSGEANVIDLFAITRQADGNWSAPVLLSGDSPYPYNDQPAISDDGTKIVFDCSPVPYALEGTAICEVNTDGTGFRVLYTPDQGLSIATALHHPDYAPDGSVVFEGDWTGTEQIWRLSMTGLQVINLEVGNDNSPCVLSDGSIVSLWLGGQGFHEIKIMSATGTSAQILVQDGDVESSGLGCGR